MFSLQQRELIETGQCPHVKLFGVLRRRENKDLGVRLNAYHQGNQVIVEVNDDGRGIDTQRIRAKAIEMGLTTPEEAAKLSEQETLNFIFRPGFSTAEQVTEVSGRGVGMDVVQSVLHRLKASVSVETRARSETRGRISTRTGRTGRQPMSSPMVA